MKRAIKIFSSTRQTTSQPSSSTAPTACPSNPVPHRNAKRRNRIKLTNHDHKRKNIIQHDPKRRGEILKPIKIRTPHDDIGHALQDESRDGFVIVDLVHADERLQEADDDDGEEGEEDEGFFHHDFEDDKHGAEEAKGVEVEEEAEVEHWGREGEEVVGESVWGKWWC